MYPHKLHNLDIVFFSLPKLLEALMGARLFSLRVHAQSEKPHVQL